MAHLTLVGLSEDKTRLLLVDAAGAEFTLDIDAPLRAALRGDHARLGQLEIKMESALRPRDIQARIRAGETPEQVAQAAQTTVDKIMAFAAPVLAERAHVADRAQRASVRRKQADAGARTLGEAVTAQLREANIPAGSVTWDSWRREDGRWTVCAELSSSSRSETAHFAFDPPGNFVVAEDDGARWLVGELPPVEEAPASTTRDELRSVRQRRLTAVPAEELPLGDDALELVSEVDAEASTADLTETAAQVRAAHPDLDTLGAEPPAEAFLDRVFARQNSHDSAPDGALADEALVDGASAVSDQTIDPGPAEPGAEGPDDAHHEPPHRREVKKTRGRASVPSWDEIMFGGGTQD